MNAHNSIICNSPKVKTIPISINWGIDKQNGISFQVEYYSVPKMNELLIHIPTWLNLKNILSENVKCKINYKVYNSIYMKCSEMANL